MMRRKIRMGMVGGGPGSMIGPIHRLAARLDGEVELVCGAFSRDPERSRETAESFSYTHLFGIPSAKRQFKTFSLF